jgi:TPR repeat protein
MTGNIFINYRRDDDPAAAGWLHDRLAGAFGREHIFRDVDAIEPGLNFVQELNKQVARSDIVLVVIGRRWIDSVDEAGNARLQNESDWVRVEIEAAIKQGKRVIPVLVNGAIMPPKEDLPGPLKELAELQAAIVAHERFNSDSQKLIDAIQSIFDAQTGAASEAAAPSPPPEEAETPAAPEPPKAEAEPEPKPEPEPAQNEETENQHSATMEAVGEAIFQTVGKTNTAAAATEKETPDAAAEPETAAPPPERSRRKRLIGTLVMVGLVLAAIAGYVTWEQDHRRPYKPAYTYTPPKKPTTVAPRPVTKQPPRTASPQSTELRNLLARANKGDAWAQNRLGFFYQNGRGVARNSAQALEWYRKAAAQGNTSAQNNLGTMYARGQGVKADHYLAVSWFRKAAAKGNAPAQNNLGFSYERGRGVRQNFNTAIEWYRKAASQGYVVAYYNLGILHRDGIGMQKNYGQAISWFRKAADKGYSNAQYALGYMYEAGMGVRRNITTARIWYRKAAAQGHPRAQQALKTLK